MRDAGFDPEAFLEAWLHAGYEARVPSSNAIARFDHSLAFSTRCRIRGRELYQNIVFLPV